MLTTREVKEIISQIEKKMECAKERYRYTPEERALLKGRILGYNEVIKLVKAHAQPKRKIRIS